MLDRIELPDGSHVVREHVLHPGAVAVLPVCSDGRALLVSQYRPAVDTRLWEIPAGILEPGEPAEACAKRELLEETGYTADIWRKMLTFFTTPGFSNERIVLFFAEGLRKIARPEPGEIEDCRAFSFEQLGGMIDTNEILDAKTAVAILLYRSTVSENPSPGEGPRA